ncbi:MAG: cupin domain-containing protein [Proteobacteria bacterium]|nr:cupin domain-containing protein [Pseudomonadota bacterium]
MINFGSLTKEQFLKDYWQKKPYLFKKALNNFIQPLSADELAGLSLEEDVESRLVYQTKEAPFWHLKKGPFDEKEFRHLPETHWTLLVQGVDRFVPEVADLLANFNFIPQWRVDDVMISYAVDSGSVGPHYDNYDVFLYQAKGRRQWKLTTKDCQPENYLDDVPLRIMHDFAVEEDYILDEGDMLYLPPHVGHHGIAIGECMTYSFGYRAYQAQELLDSYAEFSAEKREKTSLYADPDWSNLRGSSELPRDALLKAKELLIAELEDESRLKHWFGSFVTSLDSEAENLLPEPLEEDDFSREELEEFLSEDFSLYRNPLCRFAYINEATTILLFINGCEWDVQAVNTDLINLVANERIISTTLLKPLLNSEADWRFIGELLILQWLSKEK